MVSDFTQLDVWKKAMDLAVRIHEITREFPKDELYGIVSQLRRASLSVTANLAEGFGRYTTPDKKHKYVQARGELIEVINALHYCERVKYINTDLRNSLLLLTSDVHRMLNALITAMRSRSE